MATKGKREPIPAAPLLNKYMDVLSDAEVRQSDIAFVLIMGAFLENVMITLLSNFFVKCPAAKKVFEIKGTLDSFSKCNEVARCLGLFPESLSNNLKIVAKIRNRFAHAHEPIGFADEQIKAWSLSLTLPDSPQLVSGTILSGNDLQEWLKQQNAKTRFASIASFMFKRLWITAFHASRCKDEKKW